MVMLIFLQNVDVISNTILETAYGCTAPVMGDFDVFRPAGATRSYTDGGEIWHVGCSVPNFTPSVQR